MEQVFGLRRVKWFYVRGEATALMLLPPLCIEVCFFPSASIFNLYYTTLRGETHFPTKIRKIDSVITQATITRQKKSYKFHTTTKNKSKSS